MRALPLALVMLAAPALAKDDPFAGRTAGAPSDCLTLSAVQGPEIVDAHTIVYRQSGRRLWRTGPVSDCPALRPLTTLVVEVWGSQLCRNDRFRVIEPGALIPSGICRFDRFVPYDRVDATKP